MDDLREVIHTLDVEDKKEFKHFLNRVKQKQKRRDAALFDILCEDQEYKSTVVMQRLYKGRNKEAYYALRKRLNEQLIDFIILKSRTKDSTAVAIVLEFINLSQYLYDRKRDRLALKYLEKAKKIAEEIDHYELLNGIYNLIIDKKVWESEKELMKVVEERRVNKIKLEQDENINLANSIIKHKLLDLEKSSSSINYNELVTGVFHEFGISDQSWMNPKVVHKLMMLSRGIIMSNKEYHSFEPFVLGKYNELLKKDAFTDKTIFYQMGLLYFIAHVLYRNKKFIEAERYLVQMKEFLNSTGKSYYVYYYPKYAQLSAAVYVFSRKLDLSQALLNGLLEDKKLNLENSDRLNITINKGINYFLNGEFGLAHKALMSIYHTDKWCEKYMGKEWVLKKNLMEVILFYDMEKTDIAESRLISIERTYRAILKLPEYMRVKGFLSLVKFVILHPEEVKEEKFLKTVESTIEYKPIEQEDLQAMGFYAWLKAKMQGRGLYDVWLEIAK